MELTQINHEEITANREIRLCTPRSEVLANAAHRLKFSHHDLGPYNFCTLPKKPELKLGWDLSLPNQDCYEEPGLYWLNNSRGASSGWK